MFNKGKNTLILECEERSALACVRSLGKHTSSLILASTLRHVPAFYSKYARTLPKALYPDPVNDVDKYTEAIRTICDTHEVGLILPMAEPTLLPILNNRNSKFSDVQIPFPDDAPFKLVLNKEKILRLAEAYDISVPTTWPVSEYNKIDSYQFPLMLKPYNSVVVNGNKIESYSVRWIKSKSELLELDRSGGLCGTHFLQQYVRGHGGALYFLFWKGQYIAHLEQITLTQQAGPGSVIRAIATDGIYTRELHKFKHMLQDLNWHGVIMLELRRDIEEGKTYLIEANPRFWGPMQLAVDAGVNFPWLLYALCTEGIIPNDKDIETRSCGYTWLTGTLISIVMQITGMAKDPIKPSRHNLVTEITRDIRFRDLYFRSDDPLPALFDCYYSIIRPVPKELKKKVKTLIRLG